MSNKRRRQDRDDLDDNKENNKVAINMQTPVSFRRNAKTNSSYWQPLTVGHHVHPRSWGQRTGTTTVTQRQQSRPWQSAEFVMQAKLGRGHFGSIYLATPTSNTSSTNNHQGLPRRVALKRLCKYKLRRSERGLELVQREVNIHSHLNHAHIVSFFGYYQDATHISFVLEFAPGGDLVQHMVTWTHGASRLLKAVTVLRQVASALAYLDCLHVAHRDLKPENICVVGGVCKLVDFGWSVWWSPNRYQTTLCGTPEYVPPELLVHSATTPRRYHAEYIDPWALGILGLELVQGKTPFGLTCDEEEEIDGDQQQERIFDKIRRYRGVTVPRSTYRMNKKHAARQKLFWDWVSKLVRVDPEQRLSAAQALEHAFLCPDGASSNHAQGQQHVSWSKNHSHHHQPTVAQRCQIFATQQPLCL